MLELFHRVKIGLILANDQLLSFEIRFDLTNTQNLKELSFIKSNGVPPRDNKSLKRSSIQMVTPGYTELLSLGVRYTFFFFFISLIADGPHHYNPACGHKGSSHLSPVHALHFFIAMLVQHSYNSSSNG